MQRVAMLVFLAAASCSGDGDGDSRGPGAGGAAGTTAGTGGGAAADAGRDSWQSFAREWFATYCTDCHGSGSAERDYEDLAHVTRDQAKIRCGVAPELLDGCSGFPPPSQFPIGDGPKPDDPARRRLVSWIEAGLIP